MLRPCACLMPLRFNVLNSHNKWNTHLLLPDKTFAPLKKSTNKKGTEHDKHPGTHMFQKIVTLMLGSQTSLLKPQPVTKSLHMNRDITVCESQKGSSANSIFCFLTCPCCQWTTVTLSKAKNSEMKMTRDMAINVAEKNIRNI